jgi:meso-butanediol dehydrogenase/(S,S)-butanediol dehydrogenase/diacetyl reductase
MKRFENKTALVTGAASGIGRATAERLAAEGARVLACDVNEKGLREEVQKLADAGLQVEARVLDVSDAASCGAAVAAAVEKFGGLDVLANVAGTMFMRNFLDLKQAEWLRIIGINLNGVFHMSQAALPHLLKSRGNIVNVASSTGTVGAPYGVAYSASKFGVVGFTKALAAEFASKGVRVNAVAPGNVATNMTAKVDLPADIDMQLLLRLTSLQKAPDGQRPAAARPEEIAGAIAYLASAEAGFATGSIFVIDGGQTAI